jgi:hypothetical protein
VASGPARTSWANRPKWKGGKREKENSLYFFQVDFPNAFSKDFKSFWHLNKTRHHIKYNAVA